MKKSIKSIVTALLIMSVIPSQTYASAVVSSKSVSVNINEVQAEQMLKRLNEIKEMDKSNMTKPEKKVLRKEVREIQKVMANGNGGIFISVGALIIIILLLIIIF